jgi:hypothetical protein
VANVNIDRIKMTLYGVSAQVVESATAGLEAELKRRLGVLPEGDMAAFDVGELAIGPLHSETVLDAAALRAIISERLAESISGQLVSNTRPADLTASAGGGD